MDKGCHNCVYLGRPSYDYPCDICRTKNGSAPSKWEGMVPATADMVEVVRCKDCRFYNKDTVSCSFVTTDTNWYEDDFCSYGERKIENP